MKTISGGLQEKIQDTRDLSLGSIFGVPKLKTVPETDFIVSYPKYMKDQKDTDFCTACAVTAASEDQEDIELSFEFQFAAMCKLKGRFDEWGCDLRTAMKSATKIGSIPKEKAPFNIQNMAVDRDFVANWKNWPSEIWEEASTHRKDTYYDVDGPYDFFDNIRAALWNHRFEERTIVTGATWRKSWINAPGGIIPTEYESNGFGHAFKVFGQKNINGNLYLCAQLSNGDVGDNGIYYFSREVVNKEFSKFGAYMFKDLSREQAEFYNKYKISIHDGIIKQLFKLILNKITLKI